MMSKKLIQFSFLGVLAVIFFSTCKKYPENNLWFRTPFNAIMTQWKLEQYSVDGVDSTSYDDVKMYVEKGITFADEDLVFPEQFEGGWKFMNKKKDINIDAVFTANIANFITQKNIFGGNLIWKIEKLSKKQFWLSVTYRGVNYVVHFKN